MKTEELKINEQSIKTELMLFKDKPYKCLFEYIWNSFDAESTEIEIKYDIPKNGLGYISNVRIIDNGKGWNFDDDLNTKTFLSSTKLENNSKQKTLPMGKFGRGRYSFIWIADKIEFYSNKKKLSLAHNTDIKVSDDDYKSNGTKICFVGINEIFSSVLLAEEQLIKEILLEFGWFMKGNSNIKIKINNTFVDPNKNIRYSEVFKKANFSEEVKKYLKDDFQVKIVLWIEKPTEWSKFYFFNKNNQELFKKNTGLNKKSDNFWHSVYIISDFFIGEDQNIEEDEIIDQQLDFNDKQQKKVKNKLIKEIKEKLVKIRKPYLVEQSDFLIKKLKDDKLMPDLPEFGIYDNESYDDLLKTIYVISPSLFTEKSDSEKKFICATFAGLLSTQDDNLIQIILEQLQELTEDEKDDLLDILQRSSLSNVIKTIKEIDHRLDVIEKLKVLLVEYKKDTLEVKHLQKVLDKDFWIFGEQFRLFSSTEGALKKVLIDYAKDILEIKDPELNSKPTGEVDLFLTKIESTKDTKRENIIIEIKRPSKKLGKTEFDQIEKYMRSIKEQDLCNGNNQYWKFYLIGNKYDDYIEDKIEAMDNLGEQEKGLVIMMKDHRYKIYVRKWSDILEVEWSFKMKYLKEKLQIEAKKEHLNSPDDIVNNLEK